ncbi:MAG: hypothetical protein A2383_03105 [Candidatus Pacebacteria bacterium RIFOXYB1_FULL_39_46]|nr:MAG: hypothetical protein A2182_01150 [Candidatus Pacebacteria bacterium RIFOXYA1_FULL_38_18]OGJ38412.1 MAG: hypothetical protein A2383_03105 [Candidatus Pacebacteria bacterium RIFOXYB1_FULL_39_46]OGJ40273.1 MAG: hypothetical protein A2411_03250 [Candidatus Pacebacteria bacterium RIFOXYC1_FULL_39_21]OGJ40846.1 MAG: hypothetical protein A2582_01985 [Candidatus Pacebacteria bacterium RIFOXYD1_FULL_39_27]
MEKNPAELPQATPEALETSEKQVGEEYPEFDLELVTQACKTVGIIDPEEIRSIMKTTLEKARETGQPAAQLLEEALKSLANDSSKETPTEDFSKKSE